MKNPFCSRLIIHQNSRTIGRLKVDKKLTFVLDGRLTCLFWNFRRLSLNLISQFFLTIELSLSKTVADPPRGCFWSWQNGLLTHQKQQKWAALMSRTHGRYRILSREEDNRDKNQKQAEGWKDDRPSLFVWKEDDSQTTRWPVSFLLPSRWERMAQTNRL